MNEISLEKQKANIEAFKTILDLVFDEKEKKDILEFTSNISDFFRAPCSTKFHLCCEGGLLQHSLNTYYVLKTLYDIYIKNNGKLNIEYSERTLAITGLFHDICKVNFYKKDFGKNPYIIDDEFPIGHGEKSVIMLQTFLKINSDIALAIRWHMGGFDSAVKGGELAYNNAVKICPLITILQAADSIASNILENN